MWEKKESWIEGVIDVVRNEMNNLECNGFMQWIDLSITSGLILHDNMTCSKLYTSTELWKALLLYGFPIAINDWIMSSSWLDHSLLLGLLHSTHL